MTNFEFVKHEWPAIYDDCARAEGYMASDPRATCVYSRRAAEQIVAHIYKVDALPVPYKDDLSARIGAPAFQQRTGVGIVQKLTLIRKLGNRAVHDTQPIPARAAVDVLRELHHVVLWAAFRYSANPAAIPTGAVFDPVKT